MAPLRPRMLEELLSHKKIQLVSVPGFRCVCTGLLAQELALGLQSMFPLVRVFFPLGQSMHVDISEVGPYFPLSQVV